MLHNLQHIVYRVRHVAQNLLIDILSWNYRNKFQHVVDIKLETIYKENKRPLVDRENIICLLFHLYDAIIQCILSTIE